MYQILPHIKPEETVFVRRSDGQTRNWYLESVTGTDKLVMCLGDSWTWGDSLNGIDGSDLTKPNDDEEYRKTHVYGALLAKRMDADLLNLATAGGSNLQVFNHLKKYLPYVVKKYSKVYVFATLTELCREMRDSMSWTWNLNSSSLNTVLMGYEKNMLDDFSALVKQYPQVTFRIGRNFTFTYNENKNICESHLPLTWIEVLENAQSLDVEYPKDLRFLTQLGFTPLNTTLQERSVAKGFKQELLTVFESMSTAMDWLDKSELNFHNKATRHPTEKAHELWADYLYSHI